MRAGLQLRSPFGEHGDDPRGPARPTGGCQARNNTRLRWGGGENFIKTEAYVNNSEPFSGEGDVQPQQGASAPLQVGGQRPPPSRRGLQGRGQLLRRRPARRVLEGHWFLRQGAAEMGEEKGRDELWLTRIESMVPLGDTAVSLGGEPPLLVPKIKPRRRRRGAAEEGFGHGHAGVFPPSQTKSRAACLTPKSH